MSRPVPLPPPQVITLEGWVDIMYFVMDAHSFYNFIYFILLIIVSGSLGPLGKGDPGEAGAGSPERGRLAWSQDRSHRESSREGTRHEESGKFKVKAWFYCLVPLITLGKSFPMRPPPPP